MYFQVVLIDNTAFFIYEKNNKAPFPVFLIQIPELTTLSLAERGERS
jgi:hypothetical protein